MSDSKGSRTAERRGGERTALDGAVTVQFAEQSVRGPGQNVSEEGVFFVAQGSVQVRVRVDGSEEWRTGEVVRIQAMGDNRIGIAVRFA